MQSIWKTIQHIKFLLNGEYHPEKYWDDWADDFIQDSWQVRIHPQHDWLIQQLKEINPTSILEIGCGFGRNIKFLIEKGISAKIITGCDFSAKMLDMAKGYINNKDVKLFKANVVDLPFRKDQFDLLISHGVFMHISTVNIRKATNEARRVARKIILIEQNHMPEKEKDKSGKYTFIHDYKKLFSTHGEITQYKDDKKLGLDLLVFKKDD